ncbi:hypothetical protein ACFE04_000879 [Oxalis oulophora]
MAMSKFGERLIGRFDISNRVTTCQTQLEEIQRAFGADLTNATLIQEERLLIQQLKILLTSEECFYKQKSRMEWIKLGDANTKNFHNSLRDRNARINIVSLQLENGQVTRDQSEIKSAMVEFYRQLLGANAGNQQHIDYSILTSGMMVNNDEAEATLEASRRAKDKPA